MLGELSDYDVLSVIGSGSFGTCYKVERKNDGNIFVWKAIDYGSLTEEKKEVSFFCNFLYLKMSRILL